MGQGDSPGGADADVARADALNGLGRYDEALRLVSTVLAGDPEHLGAGITAGVSLINTGRVYEAITLLEHVVRTHPHSADAARLLSFAAVRAGDPAQAVTQAQRAVQLEPWQAEAHIQLSRALSLAGAHGEAVGVARRALEVAPSSAAAHLAVSDALLSAGSEPAPWVLAEAEAHARHALALAPQDPVSQHQLGRIEMLRGRAFKATGVFASMLSAHPQLGGPTDNLNVLFRVLIVRAYLVFFPMTLLIGGILYAPAYPRSVLAIVVIGGLALLLWAVRAFLKAGQGHGRNLLWEFRRRDPWMFALAGLLGIGAIACLLSVVTPVEVAQALAVASAWAGAIGLVLVLVRLVRAARS